MAVRGPAAGAGVEEPGRAGRHVQQAQREGKEESSTKRYGQYKVC